MYYGRQEDHKTFRRTDLYQVPSKWSMCKSSVKYYEKFLEYCENLEANSLKFAQILQKNSVLDVS